MSKPCNNKISSKLSRFCFTILVVILFVEVEIIKKAVGCESYGILRSQVDQRRNTSTRLSSYYPKILLSTTRPHEITLSSIGGEQIGELRVSVFSYARYPTWRW